MSKTFTRASQNDLFKFMPGLLTGFHQDLHNIFSQGPLQDLGQEASYITDLQGCTMKFLRDRHGKTFHKTHIRSSLPGSEVARAISKFAPRHNESDTHKEPRSCASDIKIRTAPQRERSDTLKVPRGLRERYQNFAPHHKKSDQTRTKSRGGYASTCWIFTKHCAHNEKV